MPVETMRAIAKDLLRYDECQIQLGIQDTLISNYTDIVSAQDEQISNYKQIEMITEAKIIGLEQEINSRDYAISELDKTIKRKANSNKLLLSGFTASIAVIFVLLVVR